MEKKLDHFTGIKNKYDSDGEVYEQIEYKKGLRHGFHFKDYFRSFELFIEGVNAKFYSPSELIYPKNSPRSLIFNTNCELFVEKENSPYHFNPDKYLSSSVRGDIRELNLICVLSDKHPFTGVIFDSYPSEKPLIEIGVKEGIIHGPYREWYENGQLRLERIYNKGIPTGYERRWYSDGTLCTFCPFWDFQLMIPEDINVSKATNAIGEYIRHGRFGIECGEPGNFYYQEFHYYNGLWSFRDFKSHISDSNLGSRCGCGESPCVCEGPWH